MLNFLQKNFVTCFVCSALAFAQLSDVQVIVFFFASHCFDHLRPLRKIDKEILTDLYLLLVSVSFKISALNRV
jgi:hypothetical protein